jgi:hypothetical protein
MIPRDLIRENGGSYHRRPIKKNDKYVIFGILYEDVGGNQATAVVSEKSGTEAISLLEKALEDRGDPNWRLNSNPIAKVTGFKTSRKGIIFGYDWQGNCLI